MDMPSPDLYYAGGSTLAIIPIDECERIKSEAFTTSELCTARDAVIKQVEKEYGVKNTKGVELADIRCVGYDMTIYVDVPVEERDEGHGKKTTILYFVKDGRIIGKEVRGKKYWFNQ
jgi:hypothetical protein